MSFRLFSCNIRSLRFKVSDLLCETLSHSPDVIAIQETWLDDSIQDSALILNNFSIVRRDRNSRGGGVAFYLSDISLGWSIPNLHFPSTVEIICIDIHKRTNTTRLCNVYRPPNSPSSWYSSFQQCLESICDTRYDIIIVGDFNVDFLITSDSRVMKNLLNSYSLVQQLDQPTRFGKCTNTTNQKNSCIDLFITRRQNKTSLNNITIKAPFISDHCSIVCEVGKSQKRKAILKTRWLYRDADYAQLGKSITDSDWSFIIDTCIDVDGVAQRFSDQFALLLTDHIPTRQFQLRPNDAPWMTSDIRTNQRRRDRLHRLAKTHNSPSSWDKYRRQRNSVNSLVRSAKRASSDRLIDQINSPGHSKSDWWKLLKTCMNPTMNSIPTLVTNSTDGRYYHNDDFSKANILNDLFTRVTNIDDTTTAFPVMTPLTDARLTHIRLETKDILNAINDISANKSPGPDHFPPYALKQIKSEIAPILTRLFNRSLIDSHFPSIWKQSHVTPIHKKALNRILPTTAPFP